MIQKISADQRRHAGHGPFQIDIVFPGINLEPQKDPGFYNLGRFDHARLRPGAFVGMHKHQNDEILSLLKSGTMLHRDTEGHVIPLTATHLMMMNAGSGIHHEESIPADRYHDDVEMLQIFIRPEHENQEPKVQFATFDAHPPTNSWRLIGAPSGAPLTIRSRIAVWDLSLDTATVSLPPSSFKHTAWLLYMFSGTATITPQNIALHKGDSITAWDETLSLTSSGRAEIVAFMIDREATYTRSGMYSGMRQ